MINQSVDYVLAIEPLTDEQHAMTELLARAPDIAVSTHPPLTTIRQPLAEMAQETVRLLLALIDGADHVDSVVLPTELVIRASA